MRGKSAASSFNNLRRFSYEQPPRCVRFRSYKYGHHGADGAEYRLLVAGAIYGRRRFGRVDLAVLGTEDLRRQFEHDGCTGRSPGGVSPPDAVTSTPDVERDVAALIQLSKDLQGEAEELHRTAETLATKAARLRADLATQRRA